MDPRALIVLEFPKILDRLAERTAFAASRELALALQPGTSRRTIEHGLRETSEASLLFELQPDFSVRSAHDVRDAAERSRVGIVLDVEVLQEVRDTLESGVYVRNALTKLADRLPLLADRGQTIDPCVVVTQAIKESVGERGQILDSASPGLARVRAQLRTAYNRLMDALQRVLDSAAYRPMLQEALITTRGGRYVVPVRAEARNQFRGIVHDESASGATVFMEPLAAVDLNNEWRHLQLEEDKEVERVLRHLSGLVGQFADQIIAGVNSLAAIDLAVAKAKYAASLRAKSPTLEDGYRLNLIQARHPLLTGNVVPTDVWIGQQGEPDGQGRQGQDDREPEDREPEDREKDVIALVITGPNTGGKTVALKTVGLLQLMAQAGMHIPVEAGSSVAVFDQIFADIGDEQSIEQSLSTFSSHMSNIVRILGQADARSLVLLDELGAGTDPEEGSALARAILSHLVERGVRTMATTHYSELKAYAYAEPGVQNASVEFDVETLRPTYRLIIGLPGRSNALAIGQRLGLPGEILEAARVMVRPEEAQIEDLLAGIQAERDAARDTRLAAERARAAAEEQRVAAERRLDEIEDERVALLEAARREAGAELEVARQQIRRAEQRVAAAGGDRMEVLRATREV
ncbi:MAG: endonuclease MutS2, partial [Chloroflexota bacterium]|nr:endonuclease MutS2 [Chloroflexota bacterium]